MIEGNSKIELSHETLVKALQAHFDGSLRSECRVLVLSVRGLAEAYDATLGKNLPQRFSVELTQPDQNSTETPTKETT